MPGQHILLLGAGFTYNWGGWLASEVQDYLFSHAGFDQETRKYLWLAYQSGKGFEGALGAVRAAAATGSPDAVKRAADFELALRHMFRDMHDALLVNIDARYSNEVFKQLLVRFDAIYTLNQDLFLEMHYTNQYVRGSAIRDWQGVQFPGIESATTPNTVEPNAGLWTPTGVPMLINPDHQAIFKLHGSANWVSDSGELLMVMGDDKAAAIAGSPLLTEYFESFEISLSRDQTRLMTIGYGFGDGHINEAIRNAVRLAGLNVFIVDPLALQVVAKLKNVGLTDPEIGSALMGVSKRRITETYSESASAERTKVNRFFE